MKIKNIGWFYLSLTIALLILLIVWGFFLFYSPVRLSLIWAVLLIAAGIFLFYLSTITDQSILAMIAVLPVLIGGVFLFTSITKLLWRFSILGLVLLGLIGLGLLIRRYLSQPEDQRRLSLPGLALIAVCFLGLLSVSFGSMGRLLYLWPVLLMILVLVYVVFFRGKKLFKKKEAADD